MSIDAARIGALAAALTMTLAACSSGAASTDAAAPTSAPASTPATGALSPEGGSCGDAAGLQGQVEDRGTGEASAGAITIDAGEFFFAPTCVRAGAGEKLEVTVTNSGSALHNLSVGSLDIDEDVDPGESITVTIEFPSSGALSFVCKYHVASGMQGAFLVG